MSKSYLKVNYLLRLKKQIERKLIIESALMLPPPIDISQYRYIGMGSVFFADFILFHKYLNISLMSSFDREADDEVRFKFNKPFAFIDFKISDSSNFIRNNVDWDEKLFIWFDYDNPLSLDMVEDIKFVSAKAKPMDIFLVTIEAEVLTIEQAMAFNDTFDLYIMRKPETKRTIEYLPETLNQIVHSSIQEGLNAQMVMTNFLQIFNIVYKDTKKMYTFGGIFYREDQDELIKARFSDWTRISHDSTIVDINCPLLTPKEKLFLDSLVEAGNICIDPDSITGLDQDEINRYAQYYKYYPQFFESIY